MNQKVQQLKQHLNQLIKRQDDPAAIAEVREQIKLAKLTPLTSLDQLQIGTRLKIVAKSESDCYDSISVKALINMSGRGYDNSLLSAGPNDTEVILNRSRNYYFSMNKYLAGKSCWVKEIYVLPGLDKRLKAVKND